MPASHVEIKKLLGLFLQPNTFSVPDGALETANNCVISEDNVLKKRRGLYTFHTPTGTLNNLFLYQSNLLALHNDKMRYVDSNGSATTNSGEAVAETSRTGRSAEANNNFYFTTDSGVLKLTAYNSAVTKSGTPPALDLRGVIVTATGDWLPTGNEVNFRVIFGLKDANNNLVLGAPSDVLTVANTSGADRSVRLEFSLPDGVNSTDYFYQIYRGSYAPSDPLFDFKLIVQQNITASQITNKVIYYTDTTAELFRTNSEELYTNENSREGEGQANERPPLCQDMVLFRDQLFYANCITRHAISFNLVAPASIVNNDYIRIQQGTSPSPTVRKYVFRTGVGNTTTSASCAGTTTITATLGASHGLIATDVIYVSGASGGGTNITEGEYTITSVGATTVTFTANTGANSTAAYVQGLKVAAGDYIATLVTTGTLATQLDQTARGIVKAINRDSSSVVTARYLSASDTTPGGILLQSKTFDTDAIQIEANTTTVGGAFSPVLPAAFGTSVQSDNQSLPNIVYVSKLSEPEAVPLGNQVVVGAKNKAILRIFALKDSVIVLKEDGVFRIDGDNITNYQSTIIDNTVYCLVGNSAALLNNQVYFISNQGVCVANPSGVNILSRNIELPITAVLGSANLSAQTSACAYESERLYLISTLMPNTSTASVVYCFNTLTEAWTTWDQTFINGTVGPGDKLFTISTGNVIKKERKEQNKLDYCDESYSVTVVSVPSSNLGAVVTSASITPQVGDVLVKSSVISRIKTSTATGNPNEYSLVFEFQTNLAAADTPTLYKKFITTIKHSPFHAGMVHRSKQFSQFEVHSRDKSITTLEITFSTDTYGGSETTEWRSSAITGSSGGWGLEPWGFFPWGNPDATNLTYATQSAPIVRIYVPLFAQRSSFIQAILEHKMAAEPLNIQAFGYTVRGYGERVSR